MSRNLMLMLLVVMFVSAGCSEDVERPVTVPVTGTVMYKQKPVDGATVSFMAEGASRAASGVTDAEGKFVLSTFAANDGALIGEHVVTVSKLTAQAEAAGDPTANMNDPSKLTQVWEQSKDADLAAVKTLLPEKYANANTTPLKEKVSETGENTFILQLTD
ncbi:MAG: carboxypeptidase-like regulatory domain-containing protein [Planctomycetaceae bacterium]